MSVSSSSASGRPSDGAPPEVQPAVRQLLVCIDYEGQWGMPFEAPYDLEASTAKILETLSRHKARATFFTVGELASSHPDLIRAITSEGHEIALHGWRHERLNGLAGDQLDTLGEQLADVAAGIESMTGTRPIGFRAPYLLAPGFFDPDVYTLLERRGFRWTSNREIRHVVELVRPDRIGTERPWQYLRSHPDWLDGASARLLLLAINATFYPRERKLRRISSPARWLLGRTAPFYRNALLEIPLYSPLDCDLLGTPRPSSDSPQPLLDYAEFALHSCLARSGPLSMLTFHDWIITGGNRLALLDGVLSLARDENLRAVTVQSCWHRLQELAASGGPWRSC